MRRAGDVVTKQQILANVWDNDFEGDPNIVEVYIARLRGKVDRPFGRDDIETLRGTGYRLRRASERAIAPPPALAAAELRPGPGHPRGDAGRPAGGRCSSARGSSCCSLRRAMENQLVTSAQAADRRGAGAAARRRRPDGRRADRQERRDHPDPGGTEGQIVATDHPRIHSILRDHAGRWKGRARSTSSTTTTSSWPRGSSPGPGMIVVGRSTEQVQHATEASAAAARVRGAGRPGARGARRCGSPSAGRCGRSSRCARRPRPSPPST